MSKNHLKTLREAVKDTRKKNYDFGYAGSYPEESYEAELLDDPTYARPSMYVPDDIKKTINKWAKDMGLSTSKKSKKMNESEILVRAYVRECVSLNSTSKTRSKPELSLKEVHRRRKVMTEAIITSDYFQDILVEHAFIVLEADGSGATVGDILSAFDNAVNDMDNSMSEFLNKIVEFAKQYAPENIKNMIQKGEDQLNKAKNYAKDAKEIMDWFTKLKELAGKTVAAVKEAKAKHPDNVKKMLQWMWAEKKDVAQGIMEHFKALKGMYEKNETFKACVDKVFGEAFKKAVMTMVEQAVKLVPYGDKIVAAAKLVKNVADIGGKIKDIFASFKKAKADPKDKFAAFAEKIIQGPDRPELGAIGKAIQLDDKLEATIDDKIEAKFIKFYIDKLKNADPSTPIAQLDANKMITDYIRDQQGGVEVTAPS